MADRNRPSKNSWWLIDILALLATCLVIIWVIRLPAPNRNTLAIGKLASVDDVDIALQKPVEFDFKTKAEVLQIRSEAVQKHPELLAGVYRPSEKVFGQIVDKRPWWGMYGEFYYGKGDRSIEGPSEEARFILNPFLLVAADFYSFWQGYLSEDDLPSYNLTCQPYKLHWWPKEGRAEATYGEKCVSSRLSHTFELVAYNARDFNLNFVYVSYKESFNVSKSDIPASPISIPHFIHLGSSCGYPGGCNNMSPYTPELVGLVFKDLPARLVIRLWQDKPVSPTQTADMVFTLRFE